MEEHLNTEQRLNIINIPVEETGTCIPPQLSASSFPSSCAGPDIRRE